MPTTAWAARLGSIVSALLSGFLMIHGALNLTSTTPVRTSLTLSAVILGIVAAIWGASVLRRRRAAV